MNGEELYQKTEADLFKRQLSNSQLLDNAILRLSAVALGISLAFIKDIIPNKIPISLSLLKLSWWLFGLAIVSTLASFLTSQFGISKQLQYAKEYYLNGKNEYLHKTNYAGIITVVFNYLSCGLFAMGIVFTIVFVSSNIGGTTMSEKELKATERLTGAAQIPKMQHFTRDAAHIAPMQAVLEKGATIPAMQPILQTEHGPMTTSTPTAQPAPQAQAEHAGTGTGPASGDKNK